MLEDTDVLDDADLDAFVLFTDTPAGEIATKAEAWLSVLPAADRAEAAATVRSAKTTSKTRGRLLWLADVLRAAGLRVVELDGWQTRGAAGITPLGQLFHHTASRRGANAPSLRVVTVGRSDLRGPLCNLLVARDGTIYVVAAGRANHAGYGDWPWTPGEQVEGGNDDSIGWECENDGVGEPWPDAQLDAIERGMAAICRHLGHRADRVRAHREFARPKGRKIDPTGIDMDAWRRRVDALIEEDDMALTDDDINRIVAKVTPYAKAAVAELLAETGLIGVPQAVGMLRRMEREDLVQAFIQAGVAEGEAREWVSRIEAGKTVDA